MCLRIFRRNKDEAEEHQDEEKPTTKGENTQNPGAKYQTHDQNNNINSAVPQDGANVNPQSNNQNDANNQNNEIGEQEEEPVHWGVKTYLGMICVMTVISILAGIIIGGMGLVKLAEISENAASVYVVQQAGILQSTSPIFDLELVDADENCGSGFEILPIGYWVGVDEGCDCDGEATTEENCDSTCESTPEYDGLYLTLFNSNRFCVKRHTEFTTVPSDEDCPSDFQKCYNYLCVPEDDECPYTYLSISNVAASGPDFLSFGGTFVTYRRGDPSETSMDDQEEPIINLDIDPSGEPCLMFSYQTKTSGEYPLLKFTDCSAYGQNEQAVAVDTQNELELYEENELGETIDSLVEYRTILEETDRTMTMSAVPRLKVEDNSQCLDESNYNDLTDINVKVTDNINTQYNLLIIILVVQIVALVGTAVIFCLGVVCYFRKKSRQFRLIVSAFIFGLPQLILPLIIVGYYGSRQDERDYVNSKKEVFDTILQQGCFQNDEVMNAFGDYRDNVFVKSEEIWSILFAMVGISAASIAINGIGLIIWTVKRCKKDE